LSLGAGSCSALKPELPCSRSGMFLVRVCWSENWARLCRSLRIACSAPASGPPQPHDFTPLIKAGLLDPLGAGPRNCVNYFASSELVELSQSRPWLDAVTVRLRGPPRPIVENGGRHTPMAQVTRGMAAYANRRGREGHRAGHAARRRCRAVSLQPPPAPVPAPGPLELAAGQ
jgi:hypothetical protein